MSQSGYLRQPTIAGDAVAFVCDDDLWRVAAAGGVARRLTAGLGEPGTPVLSPDGRWLAYAGRDEQHPEVYVMPAAGGQARRLTWLGADVMVRGFTPDGRILFVSTYGQPFFRNYRAFALDVDGGLPELLPYGQVNHLSFGPNGAQVIGRNTADPARWKRYRGGMAGHLWVDAGGQGEFVRLNLPGNVTSPMWIGERIYFLSDAEGVGNLYSCRPDGGDVRRHTDHDDYYARHAASDGRRIVYQCGASIWLFDIGADRSERIQIEVPGHRTQAARRFVTAADFLASFNVHPAGHSLALEARGRLFSFALWEGAARQHGAAEVGRYRLGQSLGDGTTLVAVSDASGEERIEVFDGECSRTLPWDIGRVIALRAAPRGRRVALANHRNEVLIGDIDSGQLQRIDRSDAGRTEELAWSPDAKWLAYPFWTTLRHCAIKLAEIATLRTTLVTQPEFRDWSPAFDPEGKYLYFLSARTFDPVYDAVQFELSFPRAARPYLIALQADARAPFEPEPKGMKRDGSSQPSPDAARELRVDLEGIARRVAAFPVAEGRYGQIAGAHGRALWTVFPIAGAHGRGGHKQTPGRLEVFAFDAMKTETLAPRADRFELAADHATLIVRDDKRLRALDATMKPEPDRAAPEKTDECTRATGWIDLARVRVALDPRAEWRQMLREVWRLQREQFWDEDMSGVDWNTVYQRYAPLLERVVTRAELSDLIWEMQGELGTSHAYEMGGDHRRPPPVALGFLGADLRRSADGAGYEIAEIVRGDPWDADADSPLSAIGVNARVGERIVAVNGQAVRRDLPPQALLVNQAGIDVGWGVENYGTDPDIDIDKAPQDAVAARDRQLEKALEVALRLAADVRRPSFGVRPNLARPPLPPRR
jgi:tricorn protease